MKWLLFGYALLGMCLIASLGYVAYHFISKYW